MPALGFIEADCAMMPMSRGWRAHVLLRSARIALLLLLGWGHDAAAEAPSFNLEGFASVAANGLETTTGGGSSPVITVRTPEEFRDVVGRTDIKDKKKRQNSPRVIQVAGDLDLGTLANELPGNELKSVGVVRIPSHTTIFAVGEGATLRRGTLDIAGAANVIIRNLRFRDLWENDPSGEYDRFGWDYIRISNSGQTRSHHIWVDHCDFARAYDGALDIIHGSDLITISWCRFGGEKEAPHKKVMLIGHSSSANAAKKDIGRFNVTLHHNYFRDFADRAPRVRFGNVHVFNQLVEGAENATMSLMKAVTLVENSVYRDARIATTFSHAADTVQKGRGGTLVIVNSRNEEPRPAVPEQLATAESDGETAGAARAEPRPAVAKDASLEFEVANNFKSSVDRAALQFNPPADWKWENRNQLPYSYHLDPVEKVPELVSAFSGTGKIPAEQLPR